MHCSVKAKVKDVLIQMHCRVDDSDSFRGLFKMGCAFNWCTNCPCFEMHPTENYLMTKQKLPFISIHTYEKVVTCSEHGVLSSGVKSCPICDSMKEGEKKGKPYSSKKLVFFHNYYI